jgi:type IV pilus assembly protein PilA
MPNLQRSKMAANEASAVASLRTLNAACVNYSASWGQGFPVGLSNLGPGAPTSSSAAGLIDEVLAGGMKSGYSFVYVSGAPQSGKIFAYTINANPSTPQSTGFRYFFSDASGVIRYEYGKAASTTSKPI